MKPEQVRRVGQCVGNTVHDVRCKDGLRGFRVATQGAFKQLLMLRRRRVAKDHGNHQIADVFVEDRGVRIEQHTGAELDAALDELGWRDALEDDAHPAVSLLFELQGEANATSSALDQLLLDVAGNDQAGGFVLPALGRTSPPGEIGDGGLTVAGLGTNAAEQRRICPQQILPPHAGCRTRSARRNNRPRQLRRGQIRSNPRAGERQPLMLPAGRGGVEN